MLVEKQELSAVNLNTQTYETDDRSLFMRVVNHDFPLEFLIAGELAQFETYAIPSMSALLHQTKQYEDDGLKRLDDTRATLYALFLNAEGNPDREKMVAHLNWIHGHYKITNDDYLYTLLRMFFNPIEWIQKWGWRKLSAEELRALTNEMIKIGEQMNIQFESESYEELNRWQKEYRANYQRYHLDNQKVAEGTIEGIKAHFPRYMHSLIPLLVRAWLREPELLMSLGLEPLKPFQQRLLDFPLVLWKGLAKVYRPWRKKPFSDGWLANYYPSYENNTLVCCTLGPKKLIKHRNKTTGCPFH